MSFVYPAFLFALAALAIPVIIHLFNFRRTRKVYFSNTRFLKQIQEATSSRQKLRQLLILASRLLFLAFLVLAFAQPFIPAREQVASGREVIIYLDNSLSMTGRAGDRMTALETGLDFARRIIDIFPGDTRYLFLTNDFAPFSNSFKSSPEIQDLLTQVRSSPVSRTMREVKERIDQQGLRNTEIFWISDFQRTTLGDVRAAGIDSTEQMHLVPVYFQPSPNIFVDTAYLENPFVVGGERNTLIVKLRNSGREAVDQQLVKLLIDNVQAATTNTPIPAEGIAEISFDIASNLEGFKEVVINLNDFPVSFDNEFNLALNFSQRINVVEIHGGSGPTIVSKVFGNEKVFTYQGYQEGNVNFTALNQADLVIINGVEQPNPSLAQALSGYLNEFGTVLLIPGATPNPSFYQAIPGLPPLTFVDMPSMELERPDLRNPFFEHVFEEQAERLELPGARRILTWGADPSAMLKFRDGSPFLSLFTGTGKVYVLATPLLSTYTDLFNNALFVPVMYRIAASGKKNDFRAYYSLDDPFISVKLDSVIDEVPLRLVGAEEEIIPPQRKIGDRVNFELPRFSVEQGFYRVLFDRDTIATVALNLDKDESFLDQYTGTELMEMLGGRPNIGIFEASSAEAFSNEIKARYLGQPLWKYALALALAFLIAEILLIRFLK